MKKLHLKNALGLLLLLFTVNATAQNAIESPQEDLIQKEVKVLAPSNNQQNVQKSTFRNSDALPSEKRTLSVPASKANAYEGVRMEKVVNIQYSEDIKQTSPTTFSMSRTKEDVKQAAVQTAPLAPLMEVKIITQAEHIAHLEQTILKTQESMNSETDDLQKAKLSLQLENLQADLNSLK